MNEYINEINTCFDHTFLFAYHYTEKSQNTVLLWILISSLIVEVIKLAVKLIILIFYFFLYKQLKFIFKECHFSMECDYCFNIKKYCKYLSSILKRFYKYNFYCYIHKFQGIFSTIVFLLFESLIVYNTITIDNSITIYICSISYIIISFYIPLYYFGRGKHIYLIMSIVIVLMLLSYSLVAFLNTKHKVNNFYSIVYHLVSFIVCFISFIRIMQYDRKNETIRKLLNEKTKELYYQIDISQEKLNEISSTSDIKEYYNDTKNEHSFEMRDKYYYKICLIILFILLCLSKGFILFESFIELFYTNDKDIILELGLLLDLLSLNALSWLTFTKIEIKTLYIE